MLNSKLKEKMKDVGNKRKILKKIKFFLVWRKINDSDIKKSNKKELCMKSEKLSDTIRKQKIALCAQLVQMNPEKLLF